MTSLCSNTTQQVDIHEDFNPGQWKFWIVLIERSEREENLQTNDDENGAQDQIQLWMQDLLESIATCPGS